MSIWRRGAIEVAPEQQDRMEAAWSPMSAWIELQSVFAKAVKADDMPKARRIMDYARYSVGAPNIDVRMAVVVGFIEHLAQDKAVRDRLPELISDCEAPKWRNIMPYHAGERVAAAVEAACTRVRK